jgi:ATP-dependent Clp protease ATP-binding subunit ClpA
LDSIERIVLREVKEIGDSFDSQGITTGIAEGAIRGFCKDNYDPKVGARGLPAILRNQVETAYVNSILDNPDGKRAAMITYTVKTRSLDVQMTPVVAEAANG